MLVVSLVKPGDYYRCREINETAEKVLWVEWTVRVNS